VGDRPEPYDRRMASESGDERRTTLAVERTKLAAERTMLAWWRTGLAALAVALAVGRLVPDIADESDRWPYIVPGIGIALYALALFVYGAHRTRAEGGGLPVFVAVMAVVGVLLSLAMVGLILASS
jgi:uncharacterized membrane protein YidH (DUF202 family)